MKHNNLLRWSNKKLSQLERDLTDECMICDFVNKGKFNIANQIWNKKNSPELRENKQKFKKRNKKSSLNQWNINRRLGQMTTLHVAYRTILIDVESTESEKEEAKNQLIQLNRIKNLYYANIQDYISNLNVNTKLGEDYLEIILFAFIPASFITGYFGMNFTSMGNPGKNYNSSGLLVSKFGHYYAILLVVAFTVASYFLVSNSFFNKDAETIGTIKRFNDLLNMPKDNDYLVSNHAEI